jgi:SAM-dependent methyltransferase
MRFEISDSNSLRETAAALARCLSCAAALGGRGACPACGRDYPESGGILEAIGPLTGSNRVAAAFYDGPGWARFRPWERLFLRFQGGPARARRQILRHLPRRSNARVLEVGIGDGENLPLLPTGWSAFGVDIARNRLVACRDRFPRMAGRLARAEAEALPFADATFDAVFSVGGFNYFRDPAAALREMRRVARLGAPVVVADERPDLRRFAPGYQLGIEALDAWCLRRMGLDPEFVAMALGLRLDVDALAAREWPGHRRYPIWSRLGYCLVDPAPAKRRGSKILGSC